MDSLRRAEARATRAACPGCGAPLPDDPAGPRHAYVVTSSGCWEAFGALVAREFGDPAWSGEHRLTVDSYMAQHPAGDERRQRQSVAVHLIALCHRLEHNLEGPALLAATSRLATERREWPSLAPAPERYAMTVVDVLEAGDAAEHLEAVRRWARTTWEAWAPVHELVRDWAAQALRDAGRG